MLLTHRRQEDAVARIVLAPRARRRDGPAAGALRLDGGYERLRTIAHFNKALERRRHVRICLCDIESPCAAARVVTKLYDLAKLQTWRNYLSLTH